MKLIWTILDNESTYTIFNENGDIVFNGGSKTNFVYSHNPDQFKKEIEYELNMWFKNYPSLEYAEIIYDEYSDNCVDIYVENKKGRD